VTCLKPGQGVGGAASLLVTLPVRRSTFCYRRPAGAAVTSGNLGAVSTNRPVRQRTRPLPRGTSLYTPGASPARQAAERRSARPLIYLHQLPTWVAPLVLVGLLIAGLAVKGPAGAVALCCVAVVLGWLASVSWPRLQLAGRAGRVLAVAAMLALAAYQATR
jgi:hypothetical protein